MDWALMYCCYPGESYCHTAITIDSYICFVISTRNFIFVLLFHTPICFNRWGLSLD